MRTKVEVAKNFYRTVEQSSSSPELAEESRMVVDNLLRCNGYSNPREFIATRRGISTGFKKDKESRNVNLKLPYLSEYVSSQIVKFTRKHQLPVNIIFSPGTKLRDIFCSSRPYDKTVCTNNNCVICSNLEGGNCMVKAPVYQITCLFNTLQPEINNKEECLVIRRFLV